MSFCFARYGKYIFAFLIFALSETLVMNIAGSEPVFPVKIAHQFGETVIPSSPQRIITLGWGGDDALVALGVTPVAMTRISLFENNMSPWVEQRTQSNPPTLLEGEIDYEKIASLRPDLILAIYSGIDRSQWQLLSSIAPTVVSKSGAWSATYPEVTRLTGTAIGAVDRAESLVTSIAKYLEKQKDKFPALNGKTFTFGTYFAGSGSVVLYLATDPRVEVLTQLGMVIPPSVETLTRENPGKTSVSIPLEQVTDLDSDLLIMWYREGARAEFERQPLVHTLEAFRTGHYVALEDPVGVWATSSLSVLSIPYGFDIVLPKLNSVFVQESPDK